MNELEQRIAIAEACGWRYVRKEKDDNRMIDPQGSYSSTESIPDYTNDLNAMHEAEKAGLRENLAMDRDMRTQYWINLYEVCETTEWPFDATAAQRAEAFLKTLGLWVESK